MFDNYKTTRFFAKIVLGLGEKKAGKFSDAVKKLYDAKVTAETGTVFKITSDDLEILLDKMNKNVKRS